MKTKLLIFFLAFFSKSIFCQPQQGIEWQKCIGGTLEDVTYSIQQTSDGGYIVAGATFSNDGDVSGNHGDRDFWIVKLDNVGIIQWQKCIGGTLKDIAFSIQQTSDGGYIAVGGARSNDGDVSGFHGGNTDYWIVKLDTIGTIQWQKCLGGTGYDFAFSVRQTFDGGYIVSGWSDSNDGDVSGFHGGNNSDYWIVKLDGLGIIQWEKCLGGTELDDGRCIRQTADSGFIVGGTTFSNDGDVTGFHLGFGDYWIVKLNNSGIIQWQKCLGGSGDDRAYSIEQTLDGGYIVIGSTNSNDGDVNGNHGSPTDSTDYWIVKLTSTGTIQWQKCLGGIESETALSIKQTIDGGYIVAGFTRSTNGDLSGNHGDQDFGIIKLNSVGTIEWHKCLGGTMADAAYSIQQTSDGGYVIAGTSNSNDDDVSGNHGNDDGWLVKLSPTIGIDEVYSINFLNIFPNPASVNLNVNFFLDKTENVVIQLKDILGKNVLEPIHLKNQTGTQTSSISISQLTNGLYFLEIIDSETTITQKIIIEHE